MPKKNNEEEEKVSEESQSEEKELLLPQDELLSAGIHISFSIKLYEIIYYLNV